MTLDTKELTMDIPERYRSFASYRTTLGHKANHAFSPAANTDFRIVRHPLLGPICCPHIVKLRQGSGKDRQGMAVKVKGLKA